MSPSNEKHLFLFKILQPFTKPITLNKKNSFTLLLIMIIIYLISKLVVILMARIQNFVQTNQRIFKKTLSYYIMHITVAMLVAYVVTGNFWMALTLSLVEPTVQAFAFFFHEKVWNKKDQKALETAEVKA